MENTLPVIKTTQNAKRTFDIYQFKDKHRRDMAFMCFDYLSTHNLLISQEKYDHIYSADMEPLTDVTEELERIYEIFNVNRPNDFYGHSLSVSDVIVVHEDNISTAFFVDSIGYVKLDNFFSIENKKT